MLWYMPPGLMSELPVIVNNNIILFNHLIKLTHPLKICSMTSSALTLLWLDLWSSGFCLKKWLFIHTIVVSVETLQTDTSHKQTPLLSRHFFWSKVSTCERFDCTLEIFQKEKFQCLIPKRFTIQCTPAITVEKWENKAMFSSDCLKDVHQPSNWFFCLVFLLEVIMCVQSHKKLCHQLLDC